MSMDLGRATNKGTALLKLAHQFQQEVILRDEYISWFFDEPTISSLQNNPPDFDSEPRDDYDRILKQSYWYAILREKQGDELIERAIQAGCRQVLLLGAGYETRFFRIQAIKKNAVNTFEVDLSVTIDNKRRCLIKRLGHLPTYLTLIPLDFNRDNPYDISAYGFDKAIPSVYIWQGVSYYLPKDSVSRILDFIGDQMAPGSVFMFDSCSPLMTFKNDRIQGIAAQIERLEKIGEPYIFGMYGNEMKAWLYDKGFQDIQIQEPGDLEFKYLHRRTLPENMWYVVTIKKANSVR